MQRRARARLEEPASATIPRFTSPAPTARARPAPSPPRACAAQGHRVGLYTSPHLERVNERIQINGEQISDARARPAHPRGAGALPRGGRHARRLRSSSSAPSSPSGTSRRRASTSRCWRRGWAGGSMPRPRATPVVDRDHAHVASITWTTWATRSRRSPAEKAGDPQAGRAGRLGRQHPEALEVMERVAREQGGAAPAGRTGLRARAARARREASTTAGCGRRRPTCRLGLRGAHQRAERGRGARLPRAARGSRA